MPIKGDLSRIDLANIFQMLTLNQNEGTLNIYYGDVHKPIYFTGTDILLPFDRDAMEDRVMALLLRQGKLTDELIDRARYNTSTLNTGLLGAILQMRYASEEDVHAAFLHQMEEDIYELFLVKDAHFEFLEGEKPAGNNTLDSRFALSPNNLLMEAVRRGDEWEHIRSLVPYDVEVFELVDATLPEGIEDPNGEYAIIMGAIDGVRSIRRIIEETRLHKFTVFKNCSILVDSGKITPVDVSVLVNRADSCIETSRTLDAIDLYERAISAGIEDQFVFEKAGIAYKYVSEHRKAIAHFYRHCEQCESKGALKQGIQTYKLIRELVPTEIIARERIFQLYLNNRELFEDDEYDAEAEGTALALILKELGRSQDAVEVVNLLFDAYHENNEVLENLAKLAQEIQSAPMALMILGHLGDRLLLERDSTNALRIFRRIKCIDPEHRGVDDKLDKLIEDDLVSRKKRSRLIKTTVLVGSFILFIFAYFLFNSYAFDAFTEINHDDLLASNDFGQAREVYESFCAKYPLSIYWFLANEKLDNLEGAEERYRISEKLRAQYEAEERVASQQNAENLYVDAMASIKSSDLSTGLRLLKKSLEAATDRAWIEENRLSNEIEGLEKYFSEAEALRDKAVKFSEAGKFADAHRQLVKLVKDYARTEYAAETLFPILVTSNPSGARIHVNGEKAFVAGGGRSAVTPAVLEVTPSTRVKVEVHKEGFMKEYRMVNPFNDHEVGFELRFEAEEGFKVGPHLAQEPVVSGKDFIFGFKDGRIKRFDRESKEFTWNYTIKDLQSLDSKLGVSDKRISFCWGEGRISTLDLKDGSLLWDKALPSTAYLAPLEVKGAIFVALDTGRLMLLNPETGKTILDRDLKSKPILDPVPWERGAILFLEDGRLLWMESSKGRIVLQRRIPAEPTSVCLGNGHLIVGNARGDIDAFNMHTAEVLYSFATECALPVSQLASKQHRVFAMLGKKKIVVVDTAKLHMSGSFDAQCDQLWLSEPGGNASIVVGGSDSILYLLRASDLSVIRKYRAGAEIEFIGQTLDDHVYFYSKDGILNGLRY